MFLSSINNNTNLFIRNNSSNNTNTESSFNTDIHNQERYDLMINGITYGGIFDDYILADKITNKLNNKTNHSNKQQADEAKAFLQQEMKNFLEENKELIEKARYSEQNLDRHSQEYKEIMVENGGLELLSNLRFIEKNESIGDYDVKPDMSHPLTYLAYLKEEPTNIQNNNISLESFLLSTQTNMQKSMFDVLEVKESKYDSIIKDILSMKETLKDKIKEH